MPQPTRGCTLASIGLEAFARADRADPVIHTDLANLPFPIAQKYGTRETGQIELPMTRASRLEMARQLGRVALGQRIPNGGVHLVTAPAGGGPNRCDQRAPSGRARERVQTRFDHARCEAAPTGVDRCDVGPVLARGENRDTVGGHDAYVRARWRADNCVGLEWHGLPALDPRDRDSVDLTGKDTTRGEVTPAASETVRDPVAGHKRIRQRGDRGCLGGRERLG